MDWIEFGSNAIEHLVWPSVVAYLLHSQKAAVNELIGRIKKVEGPGGFKAEIADKAKDLKDQAKELAAKPVEQPKLEAITGTGAGLQAPNMAHGQGTVSAPVEVPDSTDLMAQFESWNRTFHVTSPKDRDERLRASGLIIEEWANLEESIRFLAHTHGVKDSREASFGLLLDQLHNQQVLSEDTLVVVMGLRKLRNAVAHSTSEPSKEAAENYANGCWAVEKRIADEELAWQLSMRKLVEGWQEAERTPK